MYKSRLVGSSYWWCAIQYRDASTASASAAASDYSYNRLNVARPPHSPTAFAVRPVVDLPLGSLTGPVFSFHFRSLRITVPHTSRAYPRDYPQPIRYRSSWSLPWIRNILAHIFKRYIFVPEPISAHTYTAYVSFLNRCYKNLIVKLTNEFERHTSYGYEMETIIIPICILNVNRDECTTTMYVRHPPRQKVIALMIADVVTRVLDRSTLCPFDAFWVQLGNSVGRRRVSGLRGRAWCVGLRVRQKLRKRRSSTRLCQRFT